MFRKLLLKLLLIGTFFVIVSGLGIAEEPAFPVINVAYHPNMNGAPPIALGESKGFFREEGITVKPFRFTAGPPEMQALAGGSLDIGFLGTGATFLVIQGGATLLTISEIGIADADAILAWPDTGIKKPQDLKGHSIAVCLGTSGEMLYLLTLEDGGLSKDQVTLLPMSPEAAITAFQSHKVDAISASVPFTYQIFKAIPNVNIVRTDEYFYKEKNFVAPNVWVVNKEFAAKKRDLVVKFLRAWLKANDYRLKHMDETAVIGSKYADIPLDVFKASIPAMKYFSSKEIVDLAKNGTVDKWMNSLSEMFVKMGRLPKTIPSDQFYDKTMLLDAAK